MVRSAEGASRTMGPMTAPMLYLGRDRPRCKPAGADHAGGLAEVSAATIRSHSVASASVATG